MFEEIIPENFSERNTDIKSEGLGKLGAPQSRVNASSLQNLYLDISYSNKRTAKTEGKLKESRRNKEVRFNEGMHKVTVEADKQRLQAFGENMRRG